MRMKLLLEANEALSEDITRDREITEISHVKGILKGKCRIFFIFHCVYFF